MNLCNKMLFVLFLLLSCCASHSLLLAQGSGSQSDLYFYGRHFSGNSFVWCVEVSADSASSLAESKLHLVSAIARLQSHQEFTVVAFNDEVSAYSEVLLAANSTKRAEAILWVENLSASGSNCLVSAGVAALSIAQSASDEAPQIILLSEANFACMGQPLDEAFALREIISVNYEQVPIHTISTGSQASAFLELLAAQNGALAIHGLPTVEYLRGDANGDLSLNITDSIVQLEYIFSARVVPCLAALDSNLDDVVDLNDVIFNLSQMFAQGGSQGPAIQECQSYQAAPNLDCQTFQACSI